MRGLASFRVPRTPVCVAPQNLPNCHVTRKRILCNHRNSNSTSKLCKYRKNVENHVRYESERKNTRPLPLKVCLKVRESCDPSPHSQTFSTCSTPCLSRDQQSCLPIGYPLKRFPLILSVGVVLSKRVNIDFATNFMVNIYQNLTFTVVSY